MKTIVKIVRYVGLGLLLSWTATAGAQTTDDALERLLQRIDDEARPRADAKSDQPGPGAVAEEDRSLDSLLEKLGQTRDEPSPNGGRPSRGEGRDEGQPPSPPEGGKPEEKPKAPGLEGDEKSLDEHLEEILGRRKKDDQDQQGEGGALGEAIKKMEEVRKRLADTDTGDETRKKQGEVVSQLDQILEQLRRAQGQSSGQSRMSRQTQQAGNRPGEPGQQPGQQGNTGEGVGPMNPLRPTTEHALANRKDIWGDLPPQLREEMENIFKEEILDAKRDLITRYFESVAEKGQSEAPR